MLRRIAIGAAIVAIVLAIVFGLLVSSTNYNYCIAHKGQHDSGQYDAKGSPIIERPVFKPTSVNLFLYCGGNFASENGNGITAIATTLLAVITILLGYLAWDQGRTTRAQLRAYVLVEKARVDGIEVGGRPNTTVTFRNFGQSPAYRVRQWSRMGTELWAEGKTFPMQEGKEVLPETQIGPGAKHRIRAKIGDQFPAMNAGHLAALQNGKGAVFVIGRLHYEDIFGDEHITEYVMFHGGPAVHGPNEMSPYEGRMKAT